MKRGGVLAVEAEAVADQDGMEIGEVTDAVAFDDGSKGQCDQDKPNARGRHDQGRSQTLV